MLTKLYDGSYGYVPVGIGGDLDGKDFYGGVFADGATARGRIESVADLSGIYSLLVGQQQAGQEKKSPIRNLTDILKKVQFIDSGNNYDAEKLQNRADIENSIFYMLSSKDCGNAFKNVGLSTPQEIIEKGLKIAARPLLTDAQYNNVLGISEAARKAFNGSEGPAVTIKPWETLTKRPIIFFSGDAFSLRNYLPESVVHEFIHAAGVDITKKWFGNKHDLSGFKGYDDIIKNCILPDAHPYHE